MRCVVAVALDAHDSDVVREDHSVHLYAPVTSTDQTTHTSTNSHFLTKFQQFCEVCNSLYFILRKVIKVVNSMENSRRLFSS